MTSKSTIMFIIFLRFGSNRAQAGQWMAGHKKWIQDGIADGSFLVAGSLDSGQGGVVIAAGQDGNTIHARVAQDPFVMHGVVSAEVHAVSTSLMAEGLAALMQRSQAGQDAP
jgi:uncharacterized protein YciI